MLGRRRQVFGLIQSLAKDRAGEAGGILSRVASSGVEIVGYIKNFTDYVVQPLGVQMHSVEHIDEGYQYHPWRTRGVREVSKIGEIVSVSPHCIIDTNFVALGAAPNSSKWAYLAPSGLITDDASLGGPKIGQFMSDLNDKKTSGLPTGSGFITIYGGGFFRGDHVNYPYNNNIVSDYVEEIQYTSPGWVRVRIKL